ncbi:DNA-directed RNA polymerase III subunit Rpc5, partial [Dunaliella salina]
MEDDEEDVIVRELDVYVSSDTAGAQLGLLSCPLRPPWRKYPYEDLEAVRMKPNAKRLEMDVPLDTTSANYAGDDEAHAARGVQKVTLRSSPVETKTSMAIGILQDGAFVLAPLEYCLQLRPHLSYLNSNKK